MSLWVNKYQPDSLDDMSYHKPLSSRLKALAASEFPHILVYGPSGAGKKTRVSALLKELFGERVVKIKMDARVFQVGSRKVEFNVISSMYHMEITPSDLGNSDRLIIQELLKEMAQTQQLDVAAKHRFKVVVINDADSLTRDAQSALRRTMEKYSANLRLILLATSTSNILSPIRSRTLLVRVGAPTEDEIVQVLSEVTAKEKIQAPQQALEHVASACQRNLRKALLMIEAMHAQNETITANSNVPPADWELVVDKIAGEIIAKRNVNTIAQIRTTFYELIAHCIPAGIIIKTLLFSLLRRISSAAAATSGEAVAKVIETGAMYDHRLRQGNKAIFHLEAFVARTMRILEEQDSR